jgi:D-alanine-D-alanine ligase
MKKMKVALVFNMKHYCVTRPKDYESEFDSKKTINAIADAIKSGGNEVDAIEANGALLPYLLKTRPDMVFNIAEGTTGSSREAQVPSILDFLRIPYTGSGVLALALALDKAKSKKLLLTEGIPTPNFQVFTTGDEALDGKMRFPMIVKPNREGSAKGIFANSIVHNKKELYRQVKKIIKIYKQEALVEKFIEGKEFTVGILGNGNPYVFPPMSIDFSECEKGGEKFYSWRVKEYQGDKAKHLVPQFECPARITKEEDNLLRETALAVHRAIGCEDISRTDIRLGKDGIPYVLEINPLPGLDPYESNFTKITGSCGMEYRELINRILKLACKRYNLMKEDKIVN